MSLSNILHFLADCFHEGYEHRSTGSIRSAISVYQVHIEGNRVGKHPLLCSLMSGVFNGRPPKPRYLFVWDVVWEILSFVKVNWGSNSELSDKNMTYKVLILMALTSSPRAYASHHLITWYMVRTPHRYKFSFHTLHKSWRKGAPPPQLVFQEYPKDK